MKLFTLNLTTSTLKHHLSLLQCRASVHVQGSCLQTNHGKSSASAECGLGSIKYSIYVGSHNCSGPVEVSTQILDVCEEGGGGAYFVKLECP